MLVLTWDSSQVGREPQRVVWTVAHKLSVLSSSLYQLLTWPLRNLSSFYKLFSSVWFRCQSRAFFCENAQSRHRAGFLWLVLATCSISKTLQHPSLICLAYPLGLCTGHSLRLGHTLSSWLTFLSLQDLSSVLSSGSLARLPMGSWEALLHAPVSPLWFSYSQYFHSVLVSWLISPNTLDTPWEETWHVHLDFNVIQQNSWHSEDMQ